MQPERAGDLARAALDTAASMTRTCEDAVEATGVTVSVKDFGNIAWLLQQVAALALDGHGKLDADGFRFWVPVPVIHAWQEELSALRQTADRPDFEFSFVPPSQSATKWGRSPS